MQFFPELARKLEGAEVIGSQRGAVTATRRLQRIYRCHGRGRFVLIGDASGSVDAITGEGISLAFRQALSLADALVADNLEQYAAAHRSMARRPVLMAQLLLMLDRLPRLRPAVLRTFAAKPVIFERLLAVHVGA